MSANIKRFFLLITFLLLVNEIVTKFEFTNIKCTSLDTEFDDFEHCYLKSVNRTYKYMYIKVNLFQTPVTKVKVNLSLKKRFSGYKPFLYNVTVDACKFLENPTANKIVNYFYGFLTTHTNINHTCPFDTDLIFDKISSEFINHRFTNILPFPEGDYLLESNWIAYDKNRAVIKIFGTLS
ncbi:uncharacterized protein LOC108113894 [Drosophila eugracilis]|uniref:uncharacterized protein LOC108113894 n=1 Tax=Drosophila eugracilis TaxID=29029 RepID=UPI0007E6E10D|nr:uncharacterized protein LOC108113894 [Drosophila eugracilis]